MEPVGRLSEKWFLYDRNPFPLQIPSKFPLLVSINMISIVFLVKINFWIIIFILKTIIKGVRNKKCKYSIVRRNMNFVKFITKSDISY